MSRYLTLRLLKLDWRSKALLTVVWMAWLVPAVVVAQDRPNLTPTAYQSFQWNDPLVISTQSLASTDSDITAEDDVIVSWAIKNAGPATVTSAFTSELRLDGKAVASYLSTSPLAQGQYILQQNIHLGTLTAGQHTFRMIADSTGKVLESNETDNTFDKTITVKPPLTPAIISLQSQPIPFGDVQVGSSSEAVVVVQHVASSKAASGQVKVTGDGFQLLDSSSFTLEKGGSATFRVRFSPTVVKGYSGLLSVETTASFSGNSTVALSGTGILPPPATGSVLVRSFLGEQELREEYNYTLTGPVTINGDTVPADFQNVPAGEYSLSVGSLSKASRLLLQVSPAAHQTLPASGKATFAVRFAPLPRAELAMLRTGPIISIPMHTDTPIPLRLLIEYADNLIHPDWQRLDIKQLSAGGSDFTLPIPTATPLRLYKTTLENPNGLFEFPIKNSSPYTHEILAVFDHHNPHPNNDSTGDPYGCADNIVCAFTGEWGKAGYETSKWHHGGESDACRGDVLYGYSNAEHLPFLNTLNYTGGNVTSPDGDQTRRFLFYDGHTGYDYLIPDSTDIYAAADGKVTDASVDTSSESSETRYKLTVTHSPPHSEYTTHYLHLSKTNVGVGDLVVSGKTIIGQSGDGHLHFTVWKHGIRVDPYGWSGAPSKDPSPIDGHDNEVLWRALP